MGSIGGSKIIFSEEGTIFSDFLLLNGEGGLGINAFVYLRNLWVDVMSAASETVWAVFELRFSVSSFCLIMVFWLPAKKSILRML